MNHFRIMWVIMVCGALLFFIIQISLRIDDYLKYGTITDIGLQIRTELPFPVVTICNQNAFHMSRTNKLGFYHFINNLFMAKNHSVGDFSSPSLSMPIGDFLENTSHALEDMIDQCTWLNRDCDIQRDFKKVMTDMGMCYSFNHNASETKFVQEDSIGLSLILNVEQYEHMRGPQSDAGIKILLHSADDAPLVQKNGFVVGPGLHTLVSISSVRHLKLEPPWGKCNKSALPASVCRTREKGIHQMKNCGCVSSFVSSVTNYSMCDMATTFSCIMQGVNEKFSCPIQCNATEYSASLSFGQLSKVNIERLVIEDSYHKEQLLKKYLRAIETYQRVDNKTVLIDVGIQKALANLTTSLKQAFVESEKEVIHTLDLIKTTADEAKKGMESIEKLYADFVAKVFMEKTTMKNLINRCLIDSLSAIYKPLDDFNTDINVPVKKCLNSDSLNVTLPLVANRTDEKEVNETLSQCTEGNYNPDFKNLDNSDCTKLLWGLSKRFVLFHDIWPNSKRYLLSIEDTYKSTVFQVFNKSKIQFNEHKECLIVLKNLASYKIKEIDTLHTAFKTFTTKSSIDRLKRAWAFIEKYSKNINSLENDLKEIEVKCWWMHTVAIMGKELRKVEHGIDKPEKFRNEVKQLSYLIEGMGKYTQQNFVGAFASMRVPVHRMTQYLNKTITKKTMFKSFLTRSFVSVISLMDEMITVTTAFNADYGKAVNDMKGTLLYQIKNLFKLELPFMTRERIFQLPFLVANNVTDSGRFGNLSIIGFDEIDTIIRNLIKKRYQMPVSDTKSKLVAILKNLEALLLSIQMMAQTFLKTTKIDNDFFFHNFLKVDIFYKDLSYEEIVQKEAFDIVSLLGEIGGFMGLLLGASILTLCELVDYIVVHVMKRWAKETSNDVKPAAHKVAWVADNRIN